ncbi:ATPase with chaperone activity [Aquincola sp. MAHUQ-54]|uniref:ATPase with chaperone activity n=1 Tax=Aquincola agrisoli TaxID=3119538 RepID=A0AAW9Q745_9BURK
MDDTSQIVIPESFIALYVSGPGKRPSLPRTELTARYELCEDLATLLTEQCQAVQFRDDLPEDIVLRRTLQGLQASPDTVTPQEAVWVVRRTAELLAWTFDV